MLVKFRYALLTLFLLFLSPAKSGVQVHNALNTINLQLIRKQLISALHSKKITDSLYNQLVTVNNRPALLNGYLATLQALKAKHAWNPYYKLKYLSESENTFKDAVARDPNNIEIRFMRFSVEHNVPGFLGYNKNLVADRREIIKQIDRKYYAQADKPLVKTVINFLLTSKRCTVAEQTDLKQHLAALQ